MELSSIVVGLNVVKRSYGDHMVAKHFYHQIVTHHGNGFSFLGRATYFRDHVKFYTDMKRSMREVLTYLDKK